MKVKPLQWDSTVEFWPWGNFDLEFLASFGGLMTRASDIRKQVYRCCINFPHESSSLASAWPVNSCSLPSFKSLFTVKLVEFNPLLFVAITIFFLCGNSR